MANTENSDEHSYLANLPNEKWFGTIDLYQWRGFWMMPPILTTMMSTKTQLKFFPDDIVLASTPKSGTTWLKALVLSIVNRKLAADDPLLTHNPHQLIPFLELPTTTDSFFATQNRRIIATHLPYQLLPESVKNSGCRIVYIARNPRDTFVSSWHFVNSRRGKPASIEEGFESFCKGISLGGPFFDHVLSYWKERERRVHFIKYEELKDDPRKQVKKLAEFLGCPLNSEEEVDEIVWRCSHERLSKLEINKKPEMAELYGFKPGSFFRRGVVGDWKNYLTPEMIERLDGIAREKLDGTGLHFQLLSTKDNQEA